MPRTNTPRTIATIALLAAAGTATAQISTSSIDTFDADNEGWRVGAAGTAPAFNPGTSFNGEPGFLSHFSDGGGPNGKWLMWSEESDWTGDYTDAGVTDISLWANGVSGSDTIMWLGFDGPGGWFFTPGQALSIADDWSRYEFDIEASDLIYAAGSGGTATAADTLANVTQFEIFTGPGPVSFASRGDLLRGGTSNNVIWFDNIAALPTPGTAAVLAFGGLLARRRR